MSSKSKLNARFAVGYVAHSRSTVWRLYTTGNDIYFSGGNSDAAKYSFHKSGICRSAYRDEFIERHGLPSNVLDRKRHGWQRADIPPAGHLRACRLLRLLIPSSSLTASADVPAKKVFWIPPAPSGTTVIELLLMNDQRSVATLAAAKNRHIVLSGTLPNTQTVLLTYHHVSGAPEAFCLPKSHHRPLSYIFNGGDPDGAKYPARLIRSNHPKDGDCLELLDVGGYEVHEEHEHRLAGLSTLTRAKVEFWTLGGGPVQKG